MLLIQAEANPWSAARRNSSRRAVIGFGPDGSCSDTPILMMCSPAPGPPGPALFAWPILLGRPPDSPGYRLTFRRLARVRHRHLGGQSRVVGDQQPVDLNAAAPAQFMDKGQYGRRH